MPLILKACSRIVQLPSWSREPAWLQISIFFLRNSNQLQPHPVGEAEAELKDFGCTIFNQPRSTYQVPAASCNMSVAMHTPSSAYNDSPNVSKDIWSTMKSQTPSLDSKNSSNYRCRYWEQKGELSTKPELPIFWKQVQHKSTLTVQQTKSGKGSSNSKQNNKQLCSNPARLIFLTEEVHHSRPFLRNSENGKLTPQTSRLSWQPSLPLCWHRDTTPRRPKIQLASAKPNHPNLIRQIWSSAQIRKKTEQSLRPARPRIVLNSLVPKTLLSTHPLFQILTHSTLSLHLTHSRYVLKSLVIRSSTFIDSVFINSAPPCICIPPIKLTPSMEPRILSSPSFWPANPFSYWGIPENWLLCHSVDQVARCTRIPLSHPLQSLDWLVWQLFPQLSQTNPSSPSVETLPIGTPSEILDHFPDIRNPFRRKPRKPRE